MAKTKKRGKGVSVTLKLNKDGTMTMRSTGGYDLRNLSNDMMNPLNPLSPLSPMNPMNYDSSPSPACDSSSSSYDSGSSSCDSGSSSSSSDGGGSCGGSD